MGEYYYQKKPICTITLVVINIIIFFVLSFSGMTEDAGYMLQHGAMYVPYILEKGMYYTFVTSMFLHFGFNHLMNNMVMLLVIGWNLEAEVGKIKFLIIYFLSGIGGNILSMLWDMRNDSYSVSAGASGAIFGIIGALLFVAIRNRGKVGTISTRGLIFMIALSLYYGLTAGQVDNAAHIGGLICGFVIAVVLCWKRKSKGCTGMEV